MPSQTVTFGIPYPLPTDPVSAGADDMRAIAETVDALPPLGYWTSPSAGTVETAGGANVRGGIVAALGTGRDLWLGADVRGDGSPLIRFGADGRATLFSSAAANLETEATFRAYGLFSSGHVFVDQTDIGAKLLFGSALDAAIYRSGAGALYADASLSIRGDGSVVGPRLGVSNNIYVLNGMMFHDGTTYDVQLIRQAANILKSTGELRADSYVVAYDGNAGVRSYLGADGASRAALVLGADAVLSREGAGNLVTGGRLTAGHVRAGGAAAGDQSVDVVQAGAFPAPEASVIKLFAQFNSGKLWLVAQWPGGARTTIAQEP